MQNTSRRPALVEPKASRAIFRSNARSTLKLDVPNTQSMAAAPNRDRTAGLRPGRDLSAIEVLGAFDVTCALVAGHLRVRA